MSNKYYHTRKHRISANDSQNFNDGALRCSLTKPKGKIDFANGLDPALISNENECDSLEKCYSMSVKLGDAE